MLDMLCLTGEVGWARLSARRTRSGAARAAPRRSRSSCASTATRWQRAARRPATRHARSRGGIERTTRARCSRRCARAARRSSAISRRRAALDADELRQAIGALVAAGLAASDGFAGLRALVRAARRPAAGARSAGELRRPVDARSRDREPRGRGHRRRVRRRGAGVGAAPPLRRRVPPAARARSQRGAVARADARLPPPRGARRDPRRPVRRRACRASSSRCPTRSSGCARSAAAGADGRLVTISAADPLNLAGIVTAGERVRAAARATASSIATACRSPSWKAISSASSRRSTRRSPPTCRAR